MQMTEGHSAYTIYFYLELNISVIEANAREEEYMLNTTLQNDKDIVRIDTINGPLAVNPNTL